MPGGGDGLAWRDGYLLVSDYDWGIYTFTANGDEVTSFPLEPGASGLAWDGKHVWTCSDGTGRIYKISLQGEVIYSFDSPNKNCRGLCWDGSYLWVAEWSDGFVGVISKLTSDGELLDSFQFPTYPGFADGLACAGEYLWVGSGALRKLTKQGDILETFSYSVGSAGLAWDGYYLWAGDGLRNVYKLEVE